MPFDTAFSVFVLAVILTTAAVSLRSFARSGRDLSGVHGSAVLGPLIRSWHFENLRPFEDWCVRHRISAATLTYAQLVASIAVGACYSAGLLFTAGWLLLATGSLDVVDGRVARRTGTGSRRGAFLDSVVDRYADSLTYIGLALYFHDSWILWLVLFGLLGGSMVSYTRARAESLGVECRVGLLQRPERTVILGFGTMFSVLLDHITGPWWGVENGLLVLTLVAIAVLSNISAVHRLVHVHAALKDDVHA
jgi:CDP-diacylglycerol--glycerol-3-phosphate 3-phosphatidyltransferase